MTAEDKEIGTMKITRRAAFDVIKASGENILTYLQGQITQDIKKLSSQQALYAVLLTPQSKAVTDFYMLQTEIKQNWAEVMFLCPSEQSAALVERLRTFAMGYALRLGKVSSWQVVSVQGEGVDDFLQTQNLPLPEQAILATNHDDDVFVLRMVESATDGVWLIGSNITIPSNVDESEMERGRIIRGVPRFAVDWDSKIHPLNANLIERGGVSFDKGCYVGQEVTSRMHWRGGIKKKLYRVQVEGIVDGLPCPVLTTAKVGTLSSLATDTQGRQLGIALLPIEVVENNQALSLEAGQRVMVVGICQ